MGAANKVPGVSGGTVSFVMNFYEEMIYTFRKINSKAFLLLFNGRFKSFYRYINGEFLLFLFGGSFFSYFTVSLLLDYFIKNYGLNVWSAFFGMILGSIFYSAKQFNHWRLKDILSVAIGVAFGISLSMMSPSVENDALWFVFLCGIVGVTGMTLPGLSGSFLLILMGNYALLLVDSVAVLYNTLTEVVIGDFSFIYKPLRIKYLKIIGVFTLGSTFGLIFFSHILGYILKRYNQLLTAMIIGFITGSLGIVWPWKKEIYKQQNGTFVLDSNGDRIVENFERYLPNIMTTETWLAFTWIAVGIGILLFLYFYRKPIEETKNA
jgi:uncharacterized membrane protein